MGISAVIAAWLALAPAHADSANPPPAPVAAQAFSLDSGGNVTVTMTDGTTQTLAMGSVLQLASASITPQAVNNAVLAAINALNLPGTYATQAQVASMAPVQAVAGLTGSPTVAQLLTVLGIGSAGLQPSTAFYSANNPNGYQTLAQMNAAVAAASLIVPGGPFTVNTATLPQVPLPACNAATAGKLAYVSDLGGGADNVKCRGVTGSGTGAWLPVGNSSIPAPISSCSTIPVNPLVTSAIQKVTCSTLATGSAVNVLNSASFAGYQFTILMPATLTGLVTSLGINVNGSATGLTLLAGQKATYAINADGSISQISVN